MLTDEEIQKKIELFRLLPKDTREAFKDMARYALAAEGKHAPETIEAATEQLAAVWVEEYSQDERQRHALDYRVRQEDERLIKQMLYDLNPDNADVTTGLDASDKEPPSSGRSR